MDEYLVTINDNKNNGNYSKLIDVMRPKASTKAYICITKFQGSVPTVVNTIPNNISVSINGSYSSFSNEPNSNIIVASQIIDEFVTNTFIPSGPSYFAFYNAENKNKNWVEINISTLSNLSFKFQNCSSYDDLINAIKYVDLPNFAFTLQFKIKFE